MRNEAIKGKWRGEIEQVDDPGDSRSIDITSSGKKIKAIILYQTDRGLVQLKADGGFHSSDQIYLEYKNSDGSVIQHGPVILILGAIPSAMGGMFLGFGPKSGKLVSGKVQLTKL